MVANETDCDSDMDTWAGADLKGGKWQLPLQLPPNSYVLKIIFLIYT